jgi:hypothetical protein
MRHPHLLWLFAIAPYLLATSALASVDPIFSDAFEGSVCNAAAQPNTLIAAEAGDAGCPAGMVKVDTFCVDRYEAALVDSGGAPWSPYVNPGSTTLLAISAAYAVPQGYINQTQAGAACVAAGKRLCTDGEWLRACQGPSASTYPYGNSYVSGACNDTRAVNPMVQLYGSNASLWTYTDFNDPCLNQLRPGLDRAGTNPACVTSEGVFDIAGNLFEWTADPAGTFRGGDYVDDTLNGNGCLYTTTAHDTLYHDYSTGFRCCADAH